MSSEASTQHMDAMLHSLFQAAYAGDKNGDVLKVLKSEHFDALSQEKKVQVLTRIEPENAVECLHRKCEPSKRMVRSDNYGLLSFIIRWDRVHCLKTVLPLLPLYCVYERDVISPNTDTGDKSTEEVLAKNNAVWEINTLTTRETIEKLCEDIRIVSEIIESTKRRLGDVKHYLENYSSDRSEQWPGTKIFQSSTIAIDKFERIRQALVLLSITGGSEQDNTAGEAIDTASECTEKAERIMLSVLGRTNNSDFRVLWCIQSANVNAEISDIDNVLRYIDIVVDNIEIGTQTVETLRRGTKRTREESESSSDNERKQEGHDRVCTLRKDATVLLAAQLFAIVGKYRATQCTTLLLKEAPDLVRVEVGGKLALRSALTSHMYSRQIAFMLEELGARVGRIDGHEFADVFTQTPVKSESHKPGCIIRYVDEFPFEVEDDEDVHEIYIPYYKRQPIHVDWHYRTNLMIAGNEDQVKNYKDHEGNTLLHILITQLNIFEDGDYDYYEFSKCINFLLKAGVDPTHRNISDHSALHVLLNSYQLYEELPYDIDATIFEWVLLLVPYFKNMNMQDESILQNLFHGHEEYCDHESWILVYQRMMENDAMDKYFIINSGRTPWQLVLKGYRMTCLVNWPSKLCRPLSKLCSLSIQKGCNISRSIDTIASNPTDRSHSSYTPEVCRNGELWAGNIHESNDCCYLSLLMVLLNNGADIMPLLKLDPQNARVVTLIRMVSDPESKYYGKKFHVNLVAPNVVKMYKICKAFVLYYPHCTENLINSLMEAVKEGQENKARERTRKLFLLLTTPRSLKFLSKRSILRSLQQKQVDRLPLPTALKVYIQEDEVEKDETD